MKNIVFAILFLLLSTPLFAQNQQGYLILVDKTSDATVYYVSELFECSFPGDHDGIDAQRIEFDKQFKAYLLDNFEMASFQNFASNWMEPGRGVYPEKIYANYLEYFSAKYPDATLIMVNDFDLACEK